MTRQLNNPTLEQYKSKLSLSDVQKEILVGTLLGDASMSKRYGRPHYSIKFEQDEEHAPYIDHLYEIFEPYTGSKPKYQSRKQKRSYWFRTYQHNDFIFYWNYFYDVKFDRDIIVSKVKRVPKNIGKHLTPRAVAYWFMDDGTFHDDINSGVRDFLFSTQGFQKHESQLLCDVLKEKWNIRANVQKDKKSWRIAILRESSKPFLALIEPYIVSCFKYKLNVTHSDINSI